jgi:DUF4097 and DUF4098 domain-containing protein YvlB
MMSGKTQNISKKPGHINCFSSENFTKVKDYIDSRILTSGMGKFYVEYPPDPEKINDGKMRSSNHPENVFDIHIDKATGQIVFENQRIKFVFHSTKGLISKKNRTKQDKKLAHEIFCYLLRFEKE